MTPTRALIEAAETTLSEMDMGFWPDSIERFRAAISSAKAAEEGVETEWRVEFRNFSGEWCKESFMPESLEAARQRLENCAINTRGVRLAQYDTYTTVIEVREKEGL